MTKKKIPAPPKKATASPSTIGEPPPNEPVHPLEIAYQRLKDDSIASGLTVTDMEQPTDTGRLSVTFVPRRTTKPQEPPSK